MENFKRVHDSIKPPVWSPASLPNLSESSLAQWTAVSDLASAQLLDDRACCALPCSQPANLDSDKFGDEGGYQTDGVIESCTRLKFSLAHFNALCMLSSLPHDKYIRFVC